MVTHAPAPLAPRKVGLAVVTETTGPEPLPSPPYPPPPPPQPFVVLCTLNSEPASWALVGEAFTITLGSERRLGSTAVDRDWCFFSRRKASTISFLGANVKSKADA